MIHIESDMWSVDQRYGRNKGCGADGDLHRILD